MKITVDHLTYIYKDKKALDDISFDINKGDLVTILGPNGSGKSTLLKCLDAILKTEPGAIKIGDKPLTDYTSAVLSRIIAYIPQSEISTMELNVFDTILLGRKPYINWHVQDKDLELTEKVMQELELEDFAFRQIKTLSGGERQRAYIARAIVQDPKIILLDEPTANLDIYHQLNVMEILKNLTEKEITVILTEHDINMAARYATKVIMLRRGKIFDCGDSAVFSEENIQKLYDIHASIHCLNDQVYIVPEKIVK